MAEKEIITNPTMGSNELGTETNEDVPTGVSAGTDTQLHMAALSTEKNAKKEENKKNINDDEIVIRNAEGESKFLEANETDE